MSPLRKSIGATLFAAFLAMSAIIAVQGYYGYRVMSAAGDMVIDTFDHPLMAVNYARAANFDFAQIERKLLQRAAARMEERRALDADIDELVSTFKDDLKVAEERSPEGDEIHQIRRIEALFGRWTAARHAGNDAAMDAFARRMDDAFDLLIEFNADHGFIGRRKAADAIEGFRYVLALTLLGAMLMAGFITILLTRRIARPLTQAASAADRIAQGEFETPIPADGADETGTLLRSMTVMQENIRTMVARESARAASAEGRLTDALETSTEGVILVGADGRVAVLNNRLRSFFPEVSALLAPGTDYAVVEALMRSQFGQSAADGADEEHRLADGRWVRIATSATSDGGKIVFVSDFTQIKQREEHYREAKREAEAASAAKSRFLANMSHELRTPLNAIIGFSEILAAQMFGRLGNERYVEYSADILRSGRHLLTVINSVLDLSKTEAGKMAIVAEPVDLADVLKDCVKMVRGQCADAGLRLHVEGLENPLPVLGERAKLCQAFLNLLSNAAKFTPPGGGIALAAGCDRAEVRVSVSDTGIGMSADDLKVALTPFGQVDNRLERKYEGTGLGLPLAKSFIELHGGTLAIDSAVGGGTRVTVRLPLRVAVADRATHTHAPVA